LWLHREAKSVDSVTHNHVISTSHGKFNVKKHTSDQNFTVPLSDKCLLTTINGQQQNFL